MRTFLQAWFGAYRDGARLFRALPWVAAAMIAVELIQHVIEWRLGMFGDPAHRAAAAASPIRLLFGWGKMLTFFAVGFLALRLYALNDARAALRPTARAVRRFAGPVLFQAAITAGVLHAGGLLALFGLPAGKDAVMAVRVVLSLAQQLLEPALFLWYVDAALGGDRYGPIGSARATGLWWFWALALTFLTRLPVNGLHQALNIWPAGKAPVVLWSALVVDAFVVVMIAASLAAIQVRIARHVAARKGLIGPDQPSSLRP